MGRLLLRDMGITYELQDEERLMSRLRIREHKYCPIFPEQA